MHKNKNILLYQYEFIIPEQFNELGKEAVISEGDMKNIFIFKYCGARGKELKANGCRRKKMVQTTAEWIEVEFWKRIPDGQNPQSLPQLSKERSGNKKTPKTK